MSWRCSVRLALASLVLAGGIIFKTGAAFGERNAFEKAAAAKVSIDEAIRTASEKVSGTIIEAELEQNHERLIWAVDMVTPDKQVMEVHIDAETGSVIDVEEALAKGKKGKRK
jgi:uncharacterized membrane protein YkoI